MKQKIGLGWNCIKTECKKIISDNQKYSIVQDQNNSKKLVLKEVRRLSKQEKNFLLRAIERFREKNKKIDCSIALKEQIEKENIVLDEEQKTYLDKAMSVETNGFGAISVLLECKNLEEITVTGYSEKNLVRVYHSAFGWLETNIFFESKQAIIDTANKIGSLSGRRLSLNTPRINCDIFGKARMNAVMPPILRENAGMTIRIFPENKLNASMLALKKSISFKCLAFLWLALESDCSLVVCGNTGSGKTTLLNSLLCFFPENERIIAIEETPELIVPHKHKLRLVAEKSASMESLIADTLRMRPDRVIVGEIRDKKETLAFENTLIAGQGKGSYATFHGLTAKESISRLCKLGFKKENISAIDLILMQKRWTRYKKKTNSFIEERKLTEVCETSEKTGTKKICWFDKKNGFSEKITKSRKVNEKICLTYNFSKSGLKKEISKRKKILEEAGQKKFGSLSKYMDFIRSKLND